MKSGHCMCGITHRFLSTQICFFQLFTGSARWCHMCDGCHHLFTESVCLSTQHPIFWLSAIHIWKKKKNMERNHQRLMLNCFTVFFWFCWRFTNNTVQTTGWAVNTKDIITCTQVLNIKINMGHFKIIKLVFYPFFFHHVRLCLLSPRRLIQYTNKFK